MDIQRQVNYNSILMDSHELDDLACKVFMDLVHPLNFITRAAQVRQLLEADHHVREEISRGLEACHREIEQAITSLANQVKFLEQRDGINQQFDDFYAGFDA